MWGGKHLPFAVTCSTITLGCNFLLNYINEAVVAAGCSRMLNHFLPKWNKAQYHFSLISVRTFINCNAKTLEGIKGLHSLFSTAMSIFKSWYSEKKTYQKIHHHPISNLKWILTRKIVVWSVTKVIGFRILL